MVISPLHFCGHFSFTLVTLAFLLLRTGFFVTIWIAAVMFKSNDILRKQTALKVQQFVDLYFKFFFGRFFYFGMGKFPLLSMVIAGVCRERGKCLFWLAFLLHSQSMWLVYTGGIRMMIFCIRWWCFLQKLYHLSGMLFSSLWWMVCFSLAICLWINEINIVAGKYVVVKLVLLSMSSHPTSFLWILHWILVRKC